MFKFFTFKWGDKYGPEYVNRLYGSLKKHYNKPFQLVCYTDDRIGILEDIRIENIEDLRRYNTDRVFTYEKIMLLERHKRGIWLDLDILIHENITEVVDKITTNSELDFVMIWNHWNDYENKSLKWWGKGSSCHINSSFVYFDQPTWLIDFTKKHWHKIEWTYKSLDKYLFYQHFRTGRIQFWRKNIFSNYNKEWFTIKNRITLFNTSHIKTNNLTEIGYELHEASQEVLDIWESYDN